MQPDKDGFYAASTTFGRHSLDKPKLDAHAAEIRTWITARLAAGASADAQAIRGIIGKCYPDLSSAEENYIFEAVI